MWRTSGWQVASVRSPLSSRLISLSDRYVLNAASTQWSQATAHSIAGTATAGG